MGFTLVSPTSQYIVSSQSAIGRKLMPFFHVQFTDQGPDFQKILRLSKDFHKKLLKFVANMS